MTDRDFTDDVASLTGETVSVLLAHHGITQRSLASLLDLSVQAAGALARGQSVPSFVTALKLSLIFGISTENLLSAERALAETTETETIRTLKAIDRGVVRIEDLLADTQRKGEEP